MLLQMGPLVQLGPIVTLVPSTNALVPETARRQVIEFHSDVYSQLSCLLVDLLRSNNRPNLPCHFLQVQAHTIIRPSKGSSHVTVLPCSTLFNTCVA